MDAYLGTDNEYDFALIDEIPINKIVLEVMGHPVLLIRVKLRDCKAPVRPYGLFIVTFILSVVSASFGVAKCIKSGPARIVNNVKCLLLSHVHIIILFYLAEGK